jgi:uncharacterized protein YdaU (DUF1376 family)
MSRTNIWMPVYIGETVARTMGLSATLLGAYTRLQWYGWVNGPIPNDDAVLASITQLPSKDLAIAKPVLSKFFREENGMWYDDYAAPLKQRAENLQRRAAAGGKGLAAVRAKKAENKQNFSINLARNEQPFSTHLAPNKQPVSIDLASNKQTFGSDLAGAKPMLNECKLKLKTKQIQVQEQVLPEEVKNTSSSSSEKPLDQPAPPKNSLEPESKKQQEILSFEPLDTGEVEQANEEKNQRKKIVREVFAYYCAPDRMNRNPVLYTLTPMRMQKGLARLEDALRMAHGSMTGATELMKAVIDEVYFSDFHMGRSPKSEGHSYCDWEKNVFKSTEQMEDWLQKSREATHREEQHA